MHSCQSSATSHQVVGALHRSIGHGHCGPYERPCALPCAQPLSYGPQAKLFTPIYANARDVRVFSATGNQFVGTTAIETANPNLAVQAPAVETGTWKWGNYNIRYQRCGNDGPAVVLIHGFGANCDHWRKNLPELGQRHRAFAIDLLGYGYSDKPSPRQQAPNTLYTFETWAEQLEAFLDEVVGGPALAVCNSVGGLVGLQAALNSPQLVPAVMIINISLRMLHESKQSPLQRPLVKALQSVLRDTPLGAAFFGSVAKPETVRNILRQCYGDKEAVTDELVKCILQPGLQPGAVDVFLDFISYSGGPTPEQLLRDVRVPVSVVWGDKDPWEKVEWGRQFKAYSCVEEFVELPGVGHCPQDEAPQQVNPLITAFIARHADKLRLTTLAP